MKLAAVFFMLGCADGSAPLLASVVPAAAPAGATIELRGERLCGEPADCATAAGEIQIGLSPPVVLATVVAYTDTAATLVIPPVTPVGATVLVATVNERVSNALAFEVLP
ncbi:MAG: hypothetical protein KF773_01075 [Deltaproteobacteria bacterium]|nr:hypothetical protein [Deltaproteobacteria bacterium]MCW5800781.1 hypothetical protein [Deltaproteobacteria bacterium]